MKQKTTIESHIQHAYEDCPKGDITTQSQHSTKTVSAKIIAKQDGVFLTTHYPMFKPVQINFCIKHNNKWNVRSKK